MAIESGVPVPADEAVQVPLSEMAVGDSILFPLERRAIVQSQASSMKRRTGKVFTIRRVGDTEARIWRKG